MADLNFPNPGVQTTYTFVGKTWNWDGQRWAFVSSGSGITKLNDLTASIQNFLIGYSGAFPNIVSSGSDHTFNLPIAGTAATGLVNTSAQTFAGAKTFSSTTNATYIGVGGVVVHGGIAISGNAAIGGSAIFTNTSNTNTLAIRSGVQASTLTYILPTGSPTAGQILSASAPSSGVVTLSWADDQVGTPSGGITQLNGLTASVQSFNTGTSGNDFNISSATSTHTFNIPDASSSARGLVTTGSQTIAGAKTFSSSIIGNLTGTATTSQNINTTSAATAGAHYLLFSPVNATTSGVAVSSDGQLQFNPATNVLTVDIFSGNLSATAATATNFYGSLVGNVTGTATTAQNINVNTYTNNSVHYLTFTPIATGSGVALSTSNSAGKLTYRPVDEQLSVTNITGIAFTATNFYGNHVGNVSGTATTAQNINTTSATTAGAHYILFSPVNATTSGVAVSSDGQLQFNPATNVLTVDIFSGNLSATAATATNFYGTLIGNVTGTATTAQNLNTVSSDTAGTHYLLFSQVNGGSGVAVSTDGNLSFVPTTNVLTTNVFNGNLSATGATVTTILNAQGDVSLGDATADTVTFNARIGSHFNPTANTTYDLGLPTFRWRNAYLDYITGVGITATTFYGSLSGTATTAQNINTTSATSAGAHYLLFSPVNATTSGVAVSSDGQLQFNPATNVLTVDIFSGNLSATAATATNFYGTLVGNVSGTATTAQNVNLAAGANNTNHSIVFSLNATGTGVGLSSDASLLYNPSTNVLTTDVFSGNLTGTAATATNFYGSLVGTATTAQNINVNTFTNNSVHYLTFTPIATGSGVALSTSNSSGKLTYRPVDEQLSVTNITGTAFTATNFYGNHVGNVSGTATTAQNINTTSATSAGAHYLLFSPVNATTSGVAVSSDGQLQFNPATNVLTVDIFSGNLSATAATATNFYGTLVGNVSGTATTAQNVNLAAGANNTNHSIVFSLNATGTGVGLSSDASLLFNPSTNVLTTDVFSGNFTGTAATATNFYGNLNGNVSGTATTSQNINTVAATTGTGHYLLFSPVNGGSGVAVSSDAQLLFSPATNVLTVDTFSGNLSGTAATATNFYGTLNGNVSGTATTAQNVNLAAGANNTNHSIVFSLNATGTGVGLSSDASLLFNPSTNVLTTDVFSGNLTGTAATATNFYGSLVGTATTAQNLNVNTYTNNSVHYLTFTPIATGSGVALSTSNSSGKLTYRPVDEQLSVTNITGTAFTATNFYGNHVGNVSGTATTAQNINTTSATTAGAHYLLFSPVNATTSGVAVSSDGQLQFNPATNVLTVDIFSGNLSGTAATATNFYGSLVGTATTAQNVNVTTTTAGGNFYLTFTNASAGSGLALTTSAVGTGFTVNPAQNTLAAGTFIGNVSGSATTSTYITGILRNASYVQGDLLAGASTGNTLTRLPVGANNRYFLKPDPNTQSGLGWSTFAGVFVTSLAPASPAFNLVMGDLWYKVDDGSFNVYYIDIDNTAQWVEIVAGSGAGGGSGTPAGSNTYVQFNDSNAFGGVSDFTFSKTVPSLALKSFPTETPSSSSVALVLTGSAVNFSGNLNGTFFGINSTSGYSGYMVDIQKNGSTKFSVNNDGSTYVATLNSNGTVYSNSGVLTNTNPSDENLKDNIQSMIGGTVYVNQLNPVSFEWKSGVGGTGTKYGFIAQEVQTVIPDVVSTDPSGTIGIDTVSLIPFLVKSIKEQQETIDNLRAEIAYIKDQLGI